MVGWMPAYAGDGMGTDYSQRSKQPSPQQKTVTPAKKRHSRKHRHASVGWHPHPPATPMLAALPSACTWQSYSARLWGTPRQYKPGESL